jgi:hypothetical protein
MKTLGSFFSDSPDASRMLETPLCLWLLEA